MADAQATYAIAVKVDSGEAVTAAKALSTLKDQINADTLALREMQKALRNLQGGTNVSIESFKNLRSQIAAKKAAIADASNRLVGMKGAFENLTPAVNKNADGIRELAADVLGVDRRIGPFKVNALKAVPPLLAISLAAGVAAAGLGILAIKAVSFGIAAADAARDQALLLEAAQIAGGALVESGDELADVVNGIASQVPLATEEVTQFAVEMAKAKLKGDALSDAIEALSIAKSAGADVSKLTAQLKAGGAVATKAAADIRKKFGPIVAAQMLSVKNQVGSLKKDFTALFSGVEIESFLIALKKVTGFFSQTESSGRAIREIITVAFSALGPIVSFLQPLVTAFFKGIVIGALLVTIALLKVRNWFRETFGGSTLGQIDFVRAAVSAGAAIVIVFAAALGTVAAVAAGVFFVLYKIASAIAFVAQTIWGIWTAAYNFLVESFTNLGPAMIDGLVNGIRNGAARVIEAVKGLATGALASFKSTLGIASPSKVFEGFGMNVAQGAERGIDRGASGVQGAADDMAPAPSPKGAGGLRGGQTIQITIGDIVVHANDPKQAPGIAQALKEELAPVFEQLAAMLGAPLEEPS